MHRAELIPELDRLSEAVIANLFNVPEALELEKALVSIASDKNVMSSFPQVSRPLDDYDKARRTATKDLVGREYALLELYLVLHGLGSGYSSYEARLMADAEGIINLPGGMLPVVAASLLSSPEMTSMDLGAGNGLQGLLLQSLCPHRKTFQVELSGSMIETGKLFQRALGIHTDRVQWICGDIATQDIAGIDLLYMYRPLKPHGKGRALYEDLAIRLSALDTEVTVLSVADCLGPFLGENFPRIYSNEFFSCYCGPTV